MEDSKKPWQSRTVLFGAITAVLGTIALFLPAAGALKANIEAHSAELAMIWGVLAIFLRFATKSKVQLKD